ncbi:MAG: Uma2 family endonuclease [Candidatus Dadabacteria bacterium]
MSIRVERRHFNVTEYNLMGERGILSEDDLVELIEGEILKMSPIGSQHAACVDRLNLLLVHFADQRAIVRVQNPIQLSDYSEPQPDFALLKPRDDFYAEMYPLPADVLLIVEVADTSLEYDRNVKVPLYARAGIPEVWMVNLLENLIEIYTDPVSGLYQRIHMAKHGESLTLQFLADVTFSVDDVLS